MSIVGIAADILHMQRAGEKLTRLRDCKTKLLHVHIRNPITGEMPAPSDGFDYRGLRTVLTQSGYNGRCSLNGRLVGSVGEIAANAAAAGIPMKG